MGKDKRMDAFARETFKLGTLYGFRHFKAELRGREEMLITIDVPAGPAGRLRLQPMSLQEALPPASPCQREAPGAAPWDDDKASGRRVAMSAPTTVSFLLAGYAHYNCPLAWVRSGHALFGANFTTPLTMDAPVELDAAHEWSQRAVHAFEFVGELVSATVYPQPTNPFELDLSVLDGLPLVDFILFSGSLCSFLRDVSLSHAPYAAQVESDLMHLLQQHYTKLPKLVAQLPPPDEANGGGGHLAAAARAATPPYLANRRSRSLDSPSTPTLIPHGFTSATLNASNALRPSPQNRFPIPPSPLAATSTSAASPALPPQPTHAAHPPHRPPLPPQPPSQQPPPPPQPPSQQPQPPTHLHPRPQQAMRPPVAPPPRGPPPGPPPGAMPPRGPPPGLAPPRGLPPAPPRGPPTAPPRGPPPGAYATVGAPHAPHAPYGLH